MRCPKCSSENLSVIDSRGDEEAIRRRRECQACSYRFTTFERIERSLPMIVKKDGRRESYDRTKIHAGLVRACEKRPVSVEVIEKIIDAVEFKISELGIKEISSRQIGDFLIDALKKVDQIAYVRFASVYREFSDISQFVDTLQSLRERSGRKKKKETVKSAARRTRVVRH
ncbi:MAG: transcriptional regulator NrdR [Oligoflexia bacterium]|nr:transcriptional regulator NrdR [Oligoflexia bacterium]